MDITEKATEVALSIVVQERDQALERVRELEKRNGKLQEALEDWAYQYPDKHLREQYQELLSE